MLASLTLERIFDVLFISSKSRNRWTDIFRRLISTPLFHAVILYLMILIIFLCFGAVSLSRRRAYFFLTSAASSHFYGARSPLHFSNRARPPNSDDGLQFTANQRRRSSRTCSNRGSSLLARLRN